MTLEERMNSIKSKMKIEDYLINKYKMVLQESGNYLKGECNLSRTDDHLIVERNFTVSPNRQIFYCFGCHRGGDLISYVAVKENVSQSKALVILEKYYWKNLTNALKIKMINKEPYEETLKELQEIQHILIENNCI